MSKRSQGTERSKRKTKEKTRQRPQPTREAATEDPSRIDAAPFAVTSDGTWLVNVNAPDAINATDLKGRTLFVGAVLRDDERQLARTVLNAASHELRARIVCALPAQHVPSQEPKTERQGGEP